MRIYEDDYLHALQRIKQSYQASRRINIIKNHRDSINPPPLRQQLIIIAREKAVEYEQICQKLLAQIAALNISVGHLRIQKNINAVYVVPHFGQMKNSQSIQIHLSQLLINTSELFSESHLAKLILTHCPPFCKQSRV